MFLLSLCTPQEKQNVDEVTVQLKWVHQAQFAGFYTAESQGYYAAENIAVSFVPGGVAVDIFDNVVNGDVEFSVVGADHLIVKRAEGLPITAIATTYRINPFVLVTFADSGITSPSDFVGRTVTTSGGYDEVQYRAMLRRVGVDPSQVDVVPYTYDNTPFLEGEVDVIVSFAAGSLLPLLTDVGSREINLIWPGDYGVHFYSDTIIVSDELLDNNPDLILRFLRATLKGHGFAIENPEIAVDATMQYAKVQDREVQMSMLEASIPLIHTGQDNIGWMRDEIWESMHNMLLEQEFLNKPLDINKVFTMTFLEQVYREKP
jgi:NitT/TauT family transport system substrate-binding protein